MQLFFYNKMESTVITFICTPILVSLIQQHGIAPALKTSPGLPPDYQ